MTSHNQVDIKLLDHSFNDSITKDHTNASIIISPFVRLDIKEIRFAIIAWIWPEEITQNTFIWNLRRSLDGFYLVHITHFFAQTSVHTENFIVDKRRNREHIENIHKLFPESDVVPFLALFVESIYFGDVFTFVVTSEKEYALRELDFVCEKEADGLDALFSTVNIVSQEQIIWMWRVFCDIHKSEEIVVLAMDVTYDLDGCRKLKKHWLRCDNVFGLINNLNDMVLSYLIWDADISNLHRK